MAYLIMFIIPLMTSSVRVIMKKFNNNTSGMPTATSIYVLLTCFVAMAYFAITAKGNIIPNMPTFIYAVFLALFFREKITKSMFLCIVISIVAIILNTL